MELKPELREIKTTKQLVDSTVSFLKQNIRSVLTIFLKYILPLTALLAYIRIQVQQKLLTIDFTDFEYISNNVVDIYKFILPYSLMLLVVIAIYQALINLYIKNYLLKNSEGHDLNTGNQLVTTVLKAITLILLSSLLSLIGFSFFVIPGIFLYVSFIVALPALVLDNFSIMYSLALSWKLINKSWWGSFLILLIGYLIYFAINILLSLPVPIIESLKIIEGGLNITTDHITIPQIVTAIYTMSVDMLSMTFPFILISFYYLSQYKTYLSEIEALQNK